MDFHLPELGEGVYEAELVEWRIKPGDTVKRGEELAEVVTDKASMSLPSPFYGKVTELRAEPGDMLKIGEVVLTYEAQARGAETAGNAKASKRKDAESEEENARTGEKIAGRKKTGKKEQATARVAPVRHGDSASNSSGGAAVRATASPTVRRMARQLGIDLTTVPGSGPGGRVLIEDVTGLLQRSDGHARRSAPQPAADYGSPGTRRKLIGVRRLIAEHMVHSKRTVPHYSYVDECDVTELVRLRASLKETFAKSGVKLTFLPFFVKAVVAALQEVPIVNASLDDTSGEISLHDRYDIGIAAATPQGLLVPVVREADRKDLTTIAREIEALSQAARDGKARREDLQGSTFTITSIGGIGGLISTPVINHPEAAILGIGRVVKRPVYDAAGVLRPADIVYLSFSFDHRILDGAIGAAFGNAVIRQLQNPAGLLVAERLVSR
jgi:pyruvate dehydrogenase E2 component (dihydrolipoamide acetyltransferase)/2-oxoisovalerate dehydrogenase E2 component (dihydrolipoyl transacylase)